MFGLILVSATVLLVQDALDRGMIEYVNTRDRDAMADAIQALESVYQRDGNWQSLAGQPRYFRRVIEDSLSRAGLNPPRQPPPPPRGSRQLPPPQPQQRLVHALLDADKQPIAGRYPEGRNYTYLPLRHEQAIVGFLAISQREHLTAGYDLSFVTDIQQRLWWWGSVLVGLCVLLTYPLARHLTLPVRRITAAVHNLTKGHYDEPLDIQRKDELGALVNDLNTLTTTLAANHQARDRWLAEISHELRTPLTVLRGQLEAMEDGVRPMTADAISLARKEVEQLQRLVEDLQTLSRLDLGALSYQMQSLDLREWLPGWLHRHDDTLSKQGIDWTLDDGNGDMQVQGDPVRLQQLVDNLVTNTVRYAKGATCLHWRLHADNNGIQLSAEDNGEGVSDDDLARLCEPLFQSVGHAQNRGLGLGLTICRRIVEAHGGTLTPFHSDKGGLGVRILLRR